MNNSLKSHKSLNRYLLKVIQPGILRRNNLKILWKDVKNGCECSSIAVILDVHKIPRFNQCTKTGPGQAPGLFSQYPVRREWFRPKTWKCILVVSNALILRIIYEFYIKNIWLIQPTNNIWKLTRIIRSRTRSLLEQQAQGPKCAGQGKTAFASRLWMNTQTHSLHLVDESCFIKEKPICSSSLLY